MYTPKTSPAWPLSLTLRIQFHPRLKTAKFLQCISIASIPNFAYEALWETRDVLYGSGTGLSACYREANMAIWTTLDWTPSPLSV